VLPAIAAAASLLAVSVATPAHAGPEGTWELRTQRGVLRFVFDRGGAGTMNGRPLEWSFDDGLLSLTIEGGTIPYRAAFHDGELRVSGGGLQREVTLSRVEGDVGPDERVVGKWRSGDRYVVELRPDGTGTNRRGAFRYGASRGLMRFDDGTAVVLLSYRIDGDRLVVDSHGETTTFERAGEDAVLPPRPEGGTSARSIVVNRKALTNEEVEKLEREHQVRILDGAYWYDPVSGAWGLEGGPTMGFLPARMELGGPLPSDASGSGSGVFVNGRELHPLDAASLQRLAPVQPGRYWVDERGNYGRDGSPSALLNLVLLSNAAIARSGGSPEGGSHITGIGLAGDGRTGYTMGRDWSVLIGE
jgi:hypothetical protein